MSLIQFPPLAKLKTRQSLKWNTYESQVLPAWIAEMDFSLAEPIRDRLIKQIMNDDLGYPQSAHEELLNEVANWMKKDFEWNVKPNDVIIVADVVRGVEIAILTHTNPGDKIVVQTPSYPPLLQAVRDHGRELIEVPLLVADNKWDLNERELEKAFASGAAMMLFSSPNNPTGKLFTAEELRVLTELARKHSVVLVSDEVHSPMVYGGKTHVPTASISAFAADSTITVTSPSKAFNTAGLRCAQLIITAKHLRQPIMDLPVKMLKGSSILGITAAVAALQEGADWLNEAMKILHRNRKVVSEFASQNQGIQYIEPEASYLAWLNFGEVAKGYSSYAQYLLEARGLAVNPGETFGKAGEGYVRVNFATSPEILDSILSKLVEAD